MGFTFRKRNTKGLNFSLSSRGARVSKTIKLGKLSLNLGRYVGGSHDGKTTSRVTASGGNGLQYEKNFTLGAKDPNPTLTKEFEGLINEQVPLATPSLNDSEQPKINIISRMYLSVWGPLVIFLSLLALIKLMWVLKEPFPMIDAFLANHAVWVLLFPFLLPWVFILPYIEHLKWDDGIGGTIMRGVYGLIGMGFAIFFSMHIGTIWHYTLGWFFRA